MRCMPCDAHTSSAQLNGLPTRTLTHFRLTLNQDLLIACFCATMCQRCASEAIQSSGAKDDELLFFWLGELSYISQRLKMAFKSCSEEHVSSFPYYPWHTVHTHSLIHENGRFAHTDTHKKKHNRQKSHIVSSLLLGKIKWN